MCDTMVALPPATVGGRVLFAKNSDRERNEAQLLQLTPALRHQPGSEVRCSYIAVPEVSETHATLLSRPFWSWGAEMGANAAGVVIGNEAVYARLPPNREPALTGMDLVRLALERALSARAAVDVIIELLERYGQGGNCGHLHDHFYDNSFLVTDPHEAYVVETVGRFWVAERIELIRAISNSLSISRGDGVRLSPALVADAYARGWCSNAENLDFAGAYLDPDRDAVTCGRMRSDRATTLLKRRAGALTPADMMSALRDHGAEAEATPHWHPAMTVGRTICMHAGGPDRRSQSVASLVSDLRPNGQAVHWVTGTSAPCISVFRPVLIGGEMPACGPHPNDHYDPFSLWWQHEIIHRAAVLGDFASTMTALAPQRDALETRFAARIDEAMNKTGPDADLWRKRAVALCWAEAEEWEQRWLQKLGAVPTTFPETCFTECWQHHNALARGALGQPLAGKR